MPERKTLQLNHYYIFSWYTFFLLSPLVALTTTFIDLLFRCWLFARYAKDGPKLFASLFIYWMMYIFVRLNAHTHTDTLSHPTESANNKHKININ